MFNYVVAKNELISQNVALLTLKPATPADNFNYAAGQYITIGWRQGSRPTPVRCFSLVSSPTEHGFAQMAMRIQGDFTTSATALAVGQVVKLQGPFGDFIIEPRASGHVMIAGGIGITPLISMLRFAAKTGISRPLTLLYSCHTQDDVTFLTELDNLARDNPRLTIIYAITNGPTDKLAGRQVIQGRLGRPLLEQIVSEQRPGAKYYLCGSPNFMNAMNDILLGLAVDADNIHAESFSQGKTAGQSALYAGIFALTALTIAGGVSLLSFKQLAANYLNATPSLRPSASPSTPAPTDNTYYQPRTAVS